MCGTKYRCNEIFQTGFARVINHAFRTFLLGIEIYFIFTYEQKLSYRTKISNDLADRWYSVNQLCITEIMVIIIFKL